MSHRRSEGEFYTISVVAEMFDLTPQTLRLYESHGLLTPSRSDGGTRMYTQEDINRLQTICHLINDLGVNIAGVEVIMKMMEQCHTREEKLKNAFQSVIRQLQQEMARRSNPSDTAVIPCSRRTEIIIHKKKSPRAAKATSSAPDHQSR